MRNKTITGKIKASVKLIENYSKNGHAAGSESKPIPVHELSEKVQAALELQSAVRQLKKEWKERKGELTGHIHQLAETRKQVRKAMKKNHKAQKPVVEKEAAAVQPKKPKLHAGRPAKKSATPAASASGKVKSKPA